MRSLPAYAHTRINGVTLAELKAMMEWPRSRIPASHTLKSWQAEVRAGIHEWTRKFEDQGKTLNRDILEAVRASSRSRQPTNPAVDPPKPTPGPSAPITPPKPDNSAKPGLAPGPSQLPPIDKSPTKKRRKETPSLEWTDAMKEQDFGAMISHLQRFRTIQQAGIGT